MSENAIILENVSKSFGRQKVLDGLGYCAQQGRISCLIGPSGCGKTTTIRIITGTLKKDTGNCTVLGSDRMTLSMLRRIGFMAQDDTVYRGLTGRENLAFFGRLGGLKHSTLSGRITELAALLQLDRDLNKLAANYSGGMKRRLSLAMALIHAPELLVLDEPTVGLDPLLRDEIWKELRRLSGSGVTILLTTHVMDEVERCDSAALMRAGRVMASGAPQKIVAEAGTANLEQAFIKYSRRQEGELPV
jgi:ABC-2 type transport system ATP-binding protein